VTEKYSIIQNYNRRYYFLFQISSKGTNHSPPEMGLEAASYKITIVLYELLLFSVKKLLLTTIKWRRLA